MEPNSDPLAGSQQLWSDPDRRKDLVAQLEERGYDDERLEDMRRLIDAPNSDIFDVLAYVRFELTPQTRYDRAAHARDSSLGDYEAAMRDFLEGVLNNYERTGITELDPDQLGNMLRTRYGAIADARQHLGDMATIRSAFLDLQRRLYES